MYMRRVRYTKIRFEEIGNTMYVDIVFESDGAVSEVRYEITDVNKGYVREVRIVRGHNGEMSWTRYCVVPEDKMDIIRAAFRKGDVATIVTLIEEVMKRGA